MNMRKLLIYFIVFVLSGIIIHLTFQYFRLPFINDSDNEKYENQYLDDLNNKAGFINMKNIFKANCHSNISIVILVLCQLKDKSLRNTIRHTWAQWISDKYSQNLTLNFFKNNYHSNNIKLFFVLGSDALQTENITENKEYLKEEMHFEDIIYLSTLQDSYMNLTLKTIAALNTVRKACSHSTFFLKIDTDVFLNIPLLFYYCNKKFDYAQKIPLIFGNKQVRAAVIRDPNSKWFVPRNKFVGDYFPDYVTGCGYIINKLAVAIILKEASKVDDLFAWEDVAVTGIYSNNVTIVDTKLFRYESFMSSIDSCYMRIIILAHRISQTKMISLWNDIIGSNTMCPTNSMKSFDIMTKALIHG